MTVDIKQYITLIPLVLAIIGGSAAFGSLQTRVEDLEGVNTEQNTALSTYDQKLYDLLAKQTETHTIVIRVDENVEKLLTIVDENTESIIRLQIQQEKGNGEG